MLDERKSTILQALIEEHIRTGEPVGSRAILDASGLGVSSATVRNELVVLEREGFVSQPHRSAGRVPSDKAYRYYVDHISPMRLRVGTRTRIEGFFRSMHSELQQLLQETSDLLAEITRYPAVVVGPGLSGDVIHGVHLVRLAPDLVLVVLVSESGRVAKELVRLTRAATAEEITSAEGLLEHALCGKQLQEASLGIAELTSDEPQGVRAVVRAAADVARRTEDVTHDIYLGGTSQLAALWADLDKVHRVLEFLEQQTRLMRVLEQTRGTSVRIGTEVGLDVGDLAVVSTSYAAGSAGEGRVGVIGPKRMDYRRTIRVVEEVGEGLGDSLGG